MTQKQAALLVLVASILKERLDPNQATVRILEEAIDDVAFELETSDVNSPSVAPSDVTENYDAAVEADAERADHKAVRRAR